MVYLVILRDNFADFSIIAKAILLSTHNIRLYEEWMKITIQLSSNTHLVCSTDFNCVELWRKIAVILV